MNEVILELKNIHKAFGVNQIHSGINLTLHRGESLGLLGGSGTGKSVLLRSIIGLEQIDIGGVTLLRAGAKNFFHVILLSDYNDYAKIGAELKASGTVD